MGPPPGREYNKQFYSNSADRNSRVKGAGANEKYGGPGESRTPDKRFRKPLLYPSELQARAMILTNLLRSAGTREYSRA
jgi:hypothetical protein